MPGSVRYRFDEFVLSPRQRLLLRNGIPVPLIPKYFDLLHLLVARRNDAVSKQTIFSEVWSDVVVSDGALSQAVRTLRRTLGDNNRREPRYIRTVSRHGYQFVRAGVLEEHDDGQFVVAPASDTTAARDTIEPLVDRLIAGTRGRAADLDEARDAAEALHELGTADALAQVIQRPDHDAAVAVMRDARWNVPGAGEVPLSAAPGAVFALVRLRIADAGRTMARRWAHAAAAGALGGALAGAAGGVALYLAPTSTARPQSSLALAAIGALAGGIGAAAVGAGLAAAEVLFRSRRGLALALGGAVSGAAAAWAAHLLLRELLDGLVGMHLLHPGGAVDGLVIGGAAGLGYAIATRRLPGGGMAAPAGARRLALVATVGFSTALAATALALAGRLLVGGLVHEIARSSRDAQLVLAPLGHLLGEPGFGPMTRTLLAALEGGAFGASLAWGLTGRPSPPR